MKLVRLLLRLVFSCFSEILSCPRSMGLSPVRLLLERTAALDHLILHIVGVLLNLAAAKALFGISNHSIMSLEILFIFAALMLILYHLVENPKTSAVIA